MSGNEYLQTILTKYAVDIEKAEAAGNAIYPTIQKWASTYLVRGEFSGSLAKGTAVSLGTDADIFISLSSKTPETLSAIYNSLYTYVTNAGYTARKQNVSIGTTVNGYKIDLVPGKRQSQNGNDHSLYLSKQKSWTKTNITTHINTVKTSGRTEEIKLIKIWRELHNLNFPSFYLELIVIDALKYSSSDLDVNIMKIFDYLHENMESNTYEDPANTNNIISDDLTASEKKIVATQALKSSNEKYWKGIVW